MNCYCGNKKKRKSYKYCSYECYWKYQQGKPHGHKTSQGGYIMSEKGKLNIAKAAIGKKHSEATKLKISNNVKLRPKPGTFIECLSCKTKFYRRPASKKKYCSRKCNKHMLGKKGILNPVYIKDRNLVKKQDKKHMNPVYGEWRSAVRNRDEYKCQLQNDDCKGRLEVHHIIPYRESVPLRYQPTNGITLCHLHHPRKREKEKTMASIFQEIVSRKSLLPVISV